MQHHVPSLSSLPLAWGLWETTPGSARRASPLAEPKGLIATLPAENTASASKCRSKPGFPLGKVLQTLQLCQSEPKRRAPAACWAPMGLMWAWHEPSSPHHHPCATGRGGYLRSLTEVLDLERAEGEVSCSLPAPLLRVSPLPENLP